MVRVALAIVWSGVSLPPTLPRHVVWLYGWAAALRTYASDLLDGWINRRCGVTMAGALVLFLWHAHAHADLLESLLLEGYTTRND